MAIDWAKQPERMLQKKAMRAALEADRLSGLLWVTFGGGWGRQLMLATQVRTEFTWGFKFRAQSGKWTGRTRVATARTKPVTLRDLDDRKTKALVNRALDAAAEQLNVH